MHSIKAGNNNSTSGVALRCQNTRGCFFSGFNWRVKNPFKKQGKLHIIDITCTTCSGYHYHRVLFTSRANLALVKQPLCFFGGMQSQLNDVKRYFGADIQRMLQEFEVSKGPTLVGMMMMSFLILSVYSLSRILLKECWKKFGVFWASPKCFNTSLLSMSPGSVQSSAGRECPTSAAGEAQPPDAVRQKFLCVKETINGLAS